MLQALLRARLSEEDLSFARCALWGVADDSRLPHFISHDSHPLHIGHYVRARTAWPGPYVEGRCYCTSISPCIQAWMAHMNDSLLPGAAVT